jgi:UDP-N-acetylglucosamine--N-acetylmuramyl-(pentapeptide) pyrophosphoryl-undecaprenol N-acetylglucosamine transferase
MMAIEYCCGPRQVEMDIYTSEGIAATVLRTGSYRGRLQGVVQQGEFAMDTLRMVASFLVNRPVAVLAMGGAASFPVLAAARLLGIRYFLHESNRIPGRVVRLFAAAATRVYTGLGGVDGSHAEMLGTPTKPINPGREGRHIIACVGGSQGAASLNRIFVEAAVQLSGSMSGTRFVLVTGRGKSIDGRGVVEIREYEPDMPSLLAQTRVLVSRAGAGALADIANARIPSILVPYPHAMDDHQSANACVYTEAGAAVMMRESELSGSALADSITRLATDSEIRSAIVSNLARFDSTDSAARIVRSIISHLPQTQLAPSSAQGASS